MERAGGFSRTLASRCPNATRESRCMSEMTMEHGWLTVRWYCGLLHHEPDVRPLCEGAPPAVLPTHAPLMVSWCHDGGNSRHTWILLNMRMKSWYGPTPQSPLTSAAHLAALCESLQ